MVFASVAVGMTFSPIITPLVFGMWLVAGISLTLIAIIWKSRKHTGATALMVLLLALVFWNVFYGLQIHTVELDAKRLWLSLSFIGVVAVPSYALFSVCALCPQGSTIPRWIKVVLAVVPGITLMLVFTNGWHHLMWGELALLPVDGSLAFPYGAWFRYVWVPFSIAVMLVILVIVLRAIIRNRGVMRAQAVSVLIAMLPPWISNAYYLVNTRTAVYVCCDITPIVFGLTAIMLALNHWLFHFLDRIPLTRDQILESMNQDMLVVDRQLRILDTNKAFLNHLHMTKRAVLGKPLFSVFPAYESQIRTVLESTGEQHHELYFEGLGYLDIHVNPMGDKGTPPGYIILLDDINKRRTAELALIETHAQLKEKVAALEQAHKTIQSYGNLVPICAWCGHRIQLPDDTWVEVETYLGQHSEMKVSHGVCPECRAKLVSEQGQDRKGGA